MDVTNAESVREAAGQLKDYAIDVLINCAGIGGAPGQRAGNIDYESWAQVLDVNTLGPSRFSDHIARSEQKLMITITSGMGSLADNTSGGYLAYRTSKAALNMMTRTAATDYWNDGIHMNSVDTGWVTDEDAAEVAARKTAEHRFHPQANAWDEEQPTPRVTPAVYPFVSYFLSLGVFVSWWFKPRSVCAVSATPASLR